jgi:hypothetical protein
MKIESTFLRKNSWKSRWLKAQLRRLATCHVCGARFLAPSPHDRFCADCRSHEERVALPLPFGEYSS